MRNDSKCRSYQYNVILAIALCMIGLTIITNIKSDSRHISYSLSSSTQYDTSSASSNLRSSLLLSSSSPSSSSSSSSSSTHKYEDLIIWSSDFHISPIADIKSILSSYNVKIIDKSLSGHCLLTNTCQKDLRIVNQQNGIDLGDCPNNLRKMFYESYRNDEEFMSADAILCLHATSMCELFMPFNKTLIVITSTRYEIGRYGSASRWYQWNDNLKMIATKPHNTIAANNRYDQEYLHYFTNLGQSIKLLPNKCGYIKARYHPTRPEILLAPARGIHLKLSSSLFQSLTSYTRSSSSSSSSYKRPLLISHIRDLYASHYEYEDLASHPTIIILPYQVSFMSLFEMYRMGIPMFIPSISLLASWHMHDAVISERTWDRVFHHPADHSSIPRHNDSLSYNAMHDGPGMIYDPNNEYHIDAIKEWITYADFYTWPHITRFDSYDHLFDMLQHITDEMLHDISSKMMIYNQQQEVMIHDAWMKILDKVVADKDMKMTRKDSSLKLPMDINDALMRSYGYKLSSTCDGQIQS